MSIDLFKDVVCYNPETQQTMNHHSILVGKRIAYCMDCGKIIIEYKNKKDFMNLMNPFD